MNYRLSISSQRAKGRRGYVVESCGKTLCENVSKTCSSVIKVDILMTLAEGLRALKPLIKHEDIVFIEIQNMHLQQWLSGLVEYKDYLEHLDTVFEVLESIDCRYRFVFVKEPYAKKVVLNSNITELKATSFSEAMKDFI